MLLIIALCDISHVRVDFNFLIKHQISPCNINAYSTPEVMRIKDMITQGDHIAFGSA